MPLRKLSQRLEFAADKQLHHALHHTLLVACWNDHGAATVRALLEARADIDNDIHLRVPGGVSMSPLWLLQ